ncbi:serine/threonine-protein kinase LATS2 [Bufo gargarizans]|uniref:serine/threonine-protein kinase LATS2 n=1 Tax=Bufo gargarizans TaxID=30331 RepID=UPI001CF58152|nr:serine/threonine-protein kinase LATS2 [Bufo gargarizans]XP_044140670.1 serine/threonine-protein kinase LATS2 [Bufo gargarizans]XP_044140671.1 serine/threonine-protein kinase LATS2 [Bufo gargarizans]
MRPKTFPTTTYSGNSRQRLQEIREGLKQPSKPLAQGISVGSANDNLMDSKVLPGKDAGRQQQQQQQLRQPAKFAPYQKALREIRYSLLPFANESGNLAAVEVNRQMLQDLVKVGCDQEMAIRALKQTGSRSIEAALEFISKMGYLDPRNEQIVQVIKQTSPGKGPAPNNVLHRSSFEGPNEPFPPYHPMNNAYDGPSFPVEGANVLNDVPRQYMDYLLSAPQPGAMNGPSPRPTTAGHQHQQKAYATSVESVAMNYTIPNQGLPIQAPHTSNSPHYARQHLIVQGEPMGYGVQRTPSFQNKMQQDGGYVNIQNKGPVAQSSPGHTFQQAPAALYMPHPHHKQSSPSHQMLVMSRGSPYTNDFPDSPQNLLNQNNMNMEMYDMGGMWQNPQSRRDSLQGPGMESSARQHIPFRPESQVPSRTNSFNNHQQQKQVQMWQTPQNKPDTSKASPTITTVTSAHILQPVKSMRVMRPEPQTAVGPSHPAWLASQAAIADNLEKMEPHPISVGGPGAYGIEAEYNNQDMRFPPPPYRTHHFHSEQHEINALCKGVEQNMRVVDTVTSSQAEEANGDVKHEKSSKSSKPSKPGKDKKQIQTSPVPVRKNSRDEEKRESRIKSYSPFAFKFYMEQHVENVLKTYQQKINRRLQLEQEMAEAGLCQAVQEQMRKILYQKESNYNRLKRAKMDKSLFVKIKTLGIGAFGEVCLASKVDTNALYAMKTLRKKDVLNRNQVAHVKAERDILAEADNEWVVKLYYSFQDKDNLYFVMDYIPGGDMMSLLIRMEVFPEHLARFYIAELTLAIESVHKMGFIHRDIKPDNILIDLDGHIKLTDFGLCTGFRWTHNSKYYQKGNHIRQDSMEPSELWDDVSNCRCGDRLKTLEQRAKRQHHRCLAHSLVGTPNYIAPEVLLRKGYTQLCDWWSVGVILFEMLVGQPPFLAPNPTETQLKVINWENTLHIPSQIKLSPEATDVITKLCCAAENRLGRNGADEIKAHPFFKSIDFSSDIRRQPAPYVPKISHPMDTSNFDPVDEESPWNESGDSTMAWDILMSPNNKHTEHAFYEFTFRRFFDDNGYPFRYPKPSRMDPAPCEESKEENQEAESSETENCQPVYV